MKPRRGSPSACAASLGLSVGRVSADVDHCLTRGDAGSSSSSGGEVGTSSRVSAGIEAVSVFYTGLSTGLSARSGPGEGDGAGYLLRMAPAALTAPSAPPSPRAAAAADPASPHSPSPLRRSSSLAKVLSGAAPSAPPPRRRKSTDLTTPPRDFEAGGGRSHAPGGAETAPALQLTASLETSGGATTHATVGLCVAHPTTLSLELGLLPLLASTAAALRPPPAPAPFRLHPREEEEHLAAAVERLARRDLDLARVPDADKGLTTPPASPPAAARMIGVQLDVVSPVSAHLSSAGMPHLHTPLLQLPRLHLCAASSPATPPRASLHVSAAVCWARLGALEPLLPAGGAATAPAPSLVRSRLSSSFNLPSPRPSHQRPPGSSSPMIEIRGTTLDLAATPPLPDARPSTVYTTTLDLGAAHSPAPAPCPSDGAADSAPHASPHTPRQSPRRQVSLLRQVSSLLFEESGDEASPAGGRHDGRSTGLASSFSHSLSFLQRRRTPSSSPLPLPPPPLPPASTLCGSGGAAPLLEPFELSLSLELPQHAREGSRRRSCPGASRQSSLSDADPFADLYSEDEEPEEDGNAGASASAPSPPARGPRGESSLPTLSVVGALPPLRVHAGSQMLLEALELGTHLASLAAPLAPSHAGDRHPGETAAAATVAKAPTAEGSGGLGGLLERASVRLQLREIEVSLALADTLADREDDIDAGGGGERRRAAEHSATGPEEGEAATASLVVRVAPLDVDLAADASGVELKVAVGRLLVLDRRRGVPAAASAALDVEAAAAAEMPLGVRVAVEGGRCVSDEARSDAACMPTSPLLCLRKRREEAEGGGSTSLVVLADASSVQLGWSPGLVAVCYRTLGEAKQAIAEAEADVRHALGRAVAPAEAPHSPSPSPPQASSGARSVEVDARVGVLSLALRAEPLPGPWPGADWDVAAGETFEVVLPFEGRPAPPIVLILADALRLELRRAVPAGGGRTDLSLAIATSVRELSVPEDQGSRAASFSMVAPLPASDSPASARRVDGATFRPGGDGGDSGDGGGDGGGGLGRLGSSGVSSSRSSGLNAARSAQHSETERAEARVLIQQGSATAGVLDVTVDVSPVCFDMRIAPMLRGIEYIERGIRKPLSRLALLGAPLPPPPQRDAAESAAAATRRPRWRINVPSALLIMPTVSDGALEFRAVDVSVASTSVSESTLLDLITVRARRMRCTAVHPPGRGPRRLAALSMVEELPELSLTLRKPLSNLAASKASVPLQQLDINLPDATAHLGLCPADVALLLGVWLDNLNVFPLLPKGKVEFDRRKTVMMRICVRLTQAALWLHDVEGHRALLRLRLDDVRVTVSKALDTKTQISVTLGSLSAHVNAVTADGDAAWLPMLAPPLDGPAAAAEASAAVGAAAEATAGAATPKDADGARPADTGVAIAVATKGEEPDEVDISLGRLCVSLHAEPLMRLTEFGAFAGSCCSAVLAAREERLASRRSAQSPHISPDLASRWSAAAQGASSVGSSAVVESTVGSTLRLAVPMIQLVVSEPSPAAVRDADGTCDDGGGAGPLPMSLHCARDVLPRMIALHFGLTLELSKAAANYDEAAAQSKTEQMTLVLRHHHACAPLGYHELPAPDATLLSPAAHEARAPGGLCTLRALPSAADSTAALLEPFKLHASQSQRLSRRHASLMLEQPIRLSLSRETLVLAAAAAAAYEHAAGIAPLEMPQPCVPTPLTPTKPAALGTGSSSASVGVAPDEQLSAIGSIPGVEVTLLSADRLPLPLVQLALGGEGQPITVAVEQASSALPLLAEACVPLSARWHNAGLLCWEPLIEPADIQLKAQQSSAGSALTTINVGLSSPLELNLSDSMLRDAQVNLRAGLAARAVRLAQWAPALQRDSSGDDPASAGGVGVGGSSGGSSAAGGGSGAAQYWISNETGESLDYWATEGETGSGPERDGQQGFGGGGGRWGGDKSGGREVRAPPDAPCRLAAGGTARLDLWDRAAAARMAVGGWCEDLPRRLTVQIEGAAPFAGLVVNQPGTSVIPVTVADEGAAPAPLARALVCEVEDRDGGTWLVIRSMMSLVNCTQRTLAVDMDLPGEPLQHAGLLRPGGGTLPVARSHLQGGLRLVDCGGGEPLSAAVAAALDAADVSAALGTAPPHLWLGALLMHDEPPPEAEEEAAWRSLSGAPESEHLVKLVTCTLSASEASVLSKATATAHAGDLYLGSAALYFLGSRTAFVKERRELSLPYSSIADVRKKSGKLPASKGITLTLAGGRGPASVVLTGFAAPNHVRHLLETLVSRCSPLLARERLTENVALRSKFGLEHDPSLFVLAEFGCALVHAEGSSKGKLYVTQRYLCFKGSLFGRETRAVYAFDEVLSVEPCESPAPNSISLACTTSEERFTFFGARAPVLAILSQMLAVSRGDHLLPTEMGAAPSAPPELTPSPFLERPRVPLQPFVVRPLPLGERCHLLATCWRFPVKATSVTGCPATVLLQAPAAVQNLLPEPLEWRITSGRGEPPVARDELPPHGELHEICCMVAGGRYALQLRLPGYDWSSPIDLDSRGRLAAADRLEMVRLRPRQHVRQEFAEVGLEESSVGSGGGGGGGGNRLEKRQNGRRRDKNSVLRLLVQLRSGCRCARQLLQVYATHWLINGTGLTLEFRIGGKPARDRKALIDAPDAAAAAELGPDLGSPASEATAGAHEGPHRKPLSPSKSAADVAAGGVRDVAAAAVHAAAAAASAAAAVVTEEARAEEEESRLNDNQTLLQSVGPGARHAIAVRVAPDAVMRQAPLAPSGGGRPGEADGGWSPSFSLLVGLGQLELGASAARSLRAGRYDLALHLAPLQGADHGRIKVVTFVQRFWLSNRVGLALECEQHDPKSGGLGSTAKAAAAAQEPSDADAAARAKASGRERSTSRIIRRTREVVPRDRTAAPLAAGERAPWHWPSTKEESLLRVRPAPGQGERGFVPGPDEGWSSAFPIDAPGSFLVFCWQGVPPEEEGWWPSLLRLLVSVELVDARIEVTFELAPPSVPPPIRVDNQTSFVATFWQRGVERAAASPHRVAASRAAPFAWAESALDHTLCVSLHRSSEAGRAHGAAVPVVEAQPVNLDAFDQSLALGSHRPAAARGVSTDSGRPSAEEEGEDESLLERSNSRRRKGSSSRRQEETVAWATVELLDGVRVLTLTEERPPAAMSSLSVDEANLIIVVDVVGVGLSVVHAAGGEECLYVSATGLKLDAVLSATAATFEFALSSFQIDNQLQYATLPAVLSLADPNPKPGTHALHLSVVKQLRAAGAAVDWWEYASCRLLELELAAEPILIQALLDFAYAARLPSLIRLLNGSQAVQPPASPAPQPVVAAGSAGSGIGGGTADAAAPQPPLVARQQRRRGGGLNRSARDLLRYGAPQRLQYFRRLELHPVRLSITFHHNNNLGLERGAPLLLVPIPHIDDAAIHLSALLREHLVGTAEELALTLLNHYKFSLLRQLMLVLLQVDMLGDPVGFMRSWGTGVKDLFYLPAKAVVQRPREFGRAVAAGSASFAKNSIGAPINSIGKFVGGLERATDRALAAMDMGKSGGRWAQARESERRHGLDSRGAKAAAKESGRHLVDGTTKLGLGILSGVVGIVREPVKGAMSDGMRGFSIGVGKGIAGAAIRPTAGALAFASGMTGAVQGLGGETEATSTHSARVGRRRPPRRLQPNTAAAGAPQRRLVPYSLSEALAQQVLHSAGEGRYASEALLHFELLTPPAPSPPPGEGSRARAAVLVLTGVRLLVVDTGSWTATLNLQLRKVAGAEPDGDRLLLVLVSRRGTGGARGDLSREASELSDKASSIVSSETSERRMLRGGGAPVERRVRVACYSEQLAADLASRITTASFYARTRRTVLQQSRALTRGGLGESSSSAATALGREMSELSASTSLWDESEDSHGGVAPRSLTPSSILEQEEEGNPAAAR